jgi:hypothetical protein
MNDEMNNDSEIPTFDGEIDSDSEIPTLMIMSETLVVKFARFCS